MLSGLSVFDIFTINTRVVGVIVPVFLFFFSNKTSSASLPEH